MKKEKAKKQKKQPEFFDASIDFSMPLYHLQDEILIYLNFDEFEFRRFSTNVHMKPIQTNVIV